MPEVIKTKVIDMGKSGGIRIPEHYLSSAGIEEHVEIVPQEGSLLIRPFVHPRAGWAEQFELMHKLGEDKINGWEDYLPTKFDEEEWEW